MRIKNLILSQFRILGKYGIILLYVIFTVIYICILAAIPASARAACGNILIFTDPAAMGLFFMGAAVLLEKSQRVESSLAVSPITLTEYIVSKIIPFAVIGVLVGAILSWFTNSSNILLAMMGVALASALFSMCGLIVGENIKTLNGFMVQTVPFEIIICVPAIFYILGLLKSDFWIIHPGVAAVRLISGNIELWFASIISLLIWLIPAYFACKKAVAKSFSSMGGAKL